MKWMSRFACPLAVMTALATGASAAPFSEYKTASCNNKDNCTVNFAVVKAGKRLEIHHVSCVEQMTTGNPDVTFIALSVLQGAVTRALHPMIAEWQGSDATTQWWVADAPMLAHVKAGQKASIRITLDAVPASQKFSCTISGFDF